MKMLSLLKAVGAGALGLGVVTGCCGSDPAPSPATPDPVSAPATGLGSVLQQRSARSANADSFARGAVLIRAANFSLTDPQEAPGNQNLDCNFGSRWNDKPLAAGESRSVTVVLGEGSTSQGYCFLKTGDELQRAREGTAELTIQLAKTPTSVSLGSVTLKLSDLVMRDKIDPGFEVSVPVEDQSVGGT